MPGTFLPSSLCRCYPKWIDCFEDWGGGGLNLLVCSFKGTGDRMAAMFLAYIAATKGIIYLLDSEVATRGFCICRIIRFDQATAEE
jgi:hypothetical protein